VLYQAAEEHGPIDVRFEGGSHRWDRLSDLAARVRDDIADLLASRAERSAAHSVKALPGRYHVLFSVLEASAVRPGRSGGRVLRDGTEVKDLFGSQVLFHPVTNGLGTLCEWTRLSARATLLKDVRHDGDLVASTTNTTVSALLGLPYFMVTDHETVAEFVGSLDGLFGAWNEELSRIGTDVAKELKKTLHESADLDELEEGSRALRGLQLSLHKFGAVVRKTLTTIFAPDLTRSPSDHEYLLRLLGLARVEARGRDISERLAAQLAEPVDARADAYAAEQRAKAEESARRQQTMVNAFLAAIAVFGFAGAFQVVQAANFEEWFATTGLLSWLGMDPALEHLAIAGGLVVLLLLLAAALVYLLAFRPRRQARRQHGRSAHRARRATVQK
jgi:hypothetical protein